MPLPAHQFQIQVRHNPLALPTEASGDPEEGLLSTLWSHGWPECRRLQASQEEEPPTGWSAASGIPGASSWVELWLQSPPNLPTQLERSASYLPSAVFTWN